MGYNTVLRIHESIELSSENNHKNDFLDNIKKIIGPFDYNYTTFNESRNLTEIFAKRINSLHKAFHFLLEAYPPIENNKKNIDHLIEWSNAYKEKYILENSDSLDELQTNLKQFTLSIKNLIKKYWNVGDNEADKLLNDSELYSLLGPVKNVATVIPMGPKYVLLYDKRLEPHNPKYLKELVSIKELHSPKLPHSFLELENDENEASRAYLENLDADIENWDNLMRQFNSFYNDWNFLLENPKKLKDELSDIKNNTGKKPQWFLDLKKCQKKMLLTLMNTTIKDLSIEKITQHIKHFNTWLAKQPNLNKDFNPYHYSKLPQWYWLLPPHQKKLLGYILNKQDNKSIEKAIAFVPSRLRTHPVPSNLGEHHLFTIDKKGNITEEILKRISSSHLVSRDLLEQPQTAINRHAKDNLQKIYSIKRKNQPLFIQTLISPLPGHEYAQYFPFANVLEKIPVISSIKKLPDSQLYKIQKERIEESEYTDIISINNPQNAIKRLNYSTIKSPGVSELLNAAKKNIPKNSPYWAVIQKYEDLLQSSCGTATFRDNNGRELYITSYQQILALNLEWLILCTCVSGKDRKALETIHTNTMLIYYQKYGEWPDYYDSGEKRKNFNLIFAKLYLSWHHHFLSEQNAPGCFGIKTIHRYLAKDTIETIIDLAKNNDIERIDDRIASNNEVKDIVKGKKFLKYFSNYNLKDFELAATIAGEENCRDLIQAINTRLKQTSLFSAAYHSYLPTGIYEITNAINKPSKKDSDTVAEILNIVNQRPKESQNRSIATQKLYSVLLDIIILPKENMLKAIDVINSLHTFTCDNAVKQISKNHHQQLIDELHLLLQEAHLFKNNSKVFLGYTPKEATGIKSIRTEIETFKKNKKKDLKKLVKGILIIANKRSHTRCYTRTVTTQRLYDLLTNIIISPSKITTLIKQIQLLKKSSYENNKMTRIKDNSEEESLNKMSCS